jgi:hypothetical protein
MCKVHRLQLTLYFQILLLLLHLHNNLANNKSKVEALSAVRSSSARDVFGGVIPIRDVGQKAQIFTPPKNSEADF